MNAVNYIVAKVEQPHFIYYEIKYMMEQHAINTVTIYVLMEFVIKFALRKDYT